MRTKKQPVIKILWNRRPRIPGWVGVLWPAVGKAVKASGRKTSQSQVLQNEKFREAMVQRKAQEGLGKQEKIFQFLDHQSGPISGAIRPLSQDTFKTDLWKQGQNTCGARQSALTGTWAQTSFIRMAIMQ